MSVYIYKCVHRHEHEETHPMSDFPRVTKCSCGGDANLIIRPNSLYVSVDRTGESGFNVGAGQYFSAKHKFDDWQKQNSCHVMTPEETAPGLQWLKDAREAKKDGVRLPEPPAKKKAPLKLKTSGYEQFIR